MRAAPGGAQEPGEHLLALYDVMMNQPLWQRRNGSDFAFFQVRAAPTVRVGPGRASCTWVYLLPAPPGRRRARRRLRRCGAAGAHGLCDRRAGYKYETTLCESFSESLHLVNVLAQRYKCAPARMRQRGLQRGRRRMQSYLPDTLAAGVTARAAPHAGASPQQPVQLRMSFPPTRGQTRTEHVFEDTPLHSQYPYAYRVG